MRSRRHEQPRRQLPSPASNYTSQDNLESAAEIQPPPGPGAPDIIHGIRVMERDKYPSIMNLHLAGTVQESHQLPAPEE